MGPERKPSMRSLPLFPRYSDSEHVKKAREKSSRGSDLVECNVQGCNGTRPSSCCFRLPGNVPEVSLGLREGWPSARVLRPHGGSLTSDKEVNTVNVLRPRIYQRSFHSTRSSVPYILFYIALGRKGGG